MPDEFFSSAGKLLTAGSYGIKIYPPRYQERIFLLDIPNGAGNVT